MSVQRVLASLEKTASGVMLILGRERLSLARLPPERLEWLARLSTPILVEVDVEDGGEVKHAIAIGSVRPHPKVAILRAVKDLRWSEARTHLDALGESVDDDVTLLEMRMRVAFAGGRASDGERDFLALCRHPALSAAQLGEAFSALPLIALGRCAPAHMARLEAFLVEDPALACSRLVGNAGPEHWSPTILHRVFDERLADAISPSELDELEALLTRVPDDTRTPAARERVLSARTKLEAKERKQRAALLASRPDFDDVEALFNTKLPAHLRRAWELHYEGTTVGFGFIEVKKTELDTLTKLAGKLAKDLGDDGRRAPADKPLRLFPFGTGEHDDEFSALDLSRPTEDGDFAVVVVFKGRGEGFLTYPSSAEWIANDGLTKY